MCEGCYCTIASHPVSFIICSVLVASFFSLVNILVVQGVRLSGKARNVREFDSCRGNFVELTESQ